MEVKVEFGPTPGEDRAGQTEYCLRCLFLFSCLAAWEKEYDMPHYDGASSSGLGKVIVRKARYCPFKAASMALWAACCRTPIQDKQTALVTLLKKGSSIITRC